MITAVEIDELYYAEPIKIGYYSSCRINRRRSSHHLEKSQQRSGSRIVHGDTYQYEEAEASVTRYKKRFDW